MTLAYSYINYTSPVPAPPRSLNGGLYTGEPFAPGAKWGNVPVVPDADTYTQNLASANPPPGGLAVLPSFNRPGNNYVNYQYAYTDFSPSYNIRCRK